MTINEWLGYGVKLVAEIGANHQGQPELAHRLVSMAARFGVDCVKGQVRTLDEHPEWEERPYVGPQSFGATYQAHREALELPLETHLNLRHAAHAAGIDYSVSVWDAPAAEAVLGVGGWSWLKVPSACLCDLDLHRVLAASGVPTVVSTGMATRDEIAAAVACYPEGGKPLILVCTSSYPCAPRDVHLSRYRTLNDWSPHGVGISGHWPGVQIDAAAVAMGYRLIERHITLDRTMRGTDHAASLGPRGVETWVRDVRVVEAAMGSEAIGPLRCEAAARAKLKGE